MQPVDLYWRFVDALNSLDRRRIRELTRPDASFESRFSTVAGRVYNGHEELDEWLDDLADAWEHIAVEPERVTEPAPHQALAFGVLNGRGRESRAEIHEPVAHLTEWDESGLLISLRYVDRAEAEGRLRRERPRVVTFDCYGTLIDWEGGLGTFLYTLARRHGDERPEPGRVLRQRWEEIQFRLITEHGWRRYHEVLADALREWCGERGYRWNENDGPALAESMRAWQPFSDTVPALRAARDAGLRLVIVSNTDRDIIEHSMRQMDVPFDDVQVAEDVRAYKPSKDVFRAALQRVGEAPEHVLHVAFGFKYDIGPAAALGMRTAWVNRHAEPRPGPVKPDFEWRDLWGLAEVARARP